MEVGIIGAPVDLGQGRRGVDMGASAIRYAGLEQTLRANGHAVRDLGNIVVAPAESMESETPQLKYLGPIVHMAGELAERVGSITKDGVFPVVLGGDHSISLGSVAGVTRQKRVGIIWLDAHGDFNTASTSPSGNIHGMVLSALAGQGDNRLVNIDGHGPKVEPHNVVLVGTRSLDDGERALLHECGVRAFTMHEVDRVGLPRVMEMAIDRITSGVDGIHVSLDLDVVDPMQAPGVGTPVFGGLSYREMHLTMEMLAETKSLCSMDVVEVNPVLDNHNATARLAMELVLSALGKRIL
ncbi:MAG: arginase [Chloroflexota bacterium]|nr:MAG: arginase [Chloroflexota bacterium]